MPAYVVLDIDVVDAQTYDKYKKLAPTSLAAYGGSYLARGGRTEVLEGSWMPKRVVILRFDTVERAKQWITSDEYRPAREIRQKAARTSMIVTEGLP
jgi:uncharacterized protein (DUF1330 family)